VTASAPSPIAQKLSAFMTLTPDETALLATLSENSRTFEPNFDIVHQGQTEHAAFILTEGWVCSYKFQPNGSRQIIDIQIPGDLIGLRSILLHTSDHSFEAITKVKTAKVSVIDLLGVFKTAPRLAMAVLWAASRDEAMIVEHLVGIGQRSAEERVVHFLLELGARLMLVGIGTPAGYDCPLTQYHLADALGISAVHVNRTLRQLRENVLLTFQNGFVTFNDYQQLVALSKFDSVYLDQDGPILK